MFPQTDGKKVGKRYRSLLILLKYFAANDAIIKPFFSSRFHIFIDHYLEIGYLEQGEMQDCYVSTNRRKESRKEISQLADSFEIFCSKRCNYQAFLSVAGFTFL